MTRLLTPGCALLAVLIFGCTLAPKPPPVPPPTPQEQEACDAFCELRASLKCDSHNGASPGPDEVLGTEDDVPCEQVCKDMLGGDVYTSDRPCLDTAETCEAAEVCVFDGGETQ